MAMGARRLGLRMYLGPSFRSGVNTATPNGVRQVTWNVDAGAQGLAAAVRFAESMDRDPSPLLNGCLLPCRIESLTKELMTGIAEAAAEHGWLVRMHCLQDPDEIEMLDERYGQDPLTVLDEVGLLGPNLLIAHGALIGGRHPDDRTRARDLARIAAAGATVVHCPVALGRYGAALDSFDGYLAAGVRMALGTDTFPPDLLRGMEYGAVFAKTTTGRPDAGQHADLYRAATLGAAAALGRPDLGRLSAGSAADITVVDLSKFESGPVDDPVRTMIMHATGRDVRRVVVAGRTVVDDWTIPGVDLTALAAEGQRIFDAIKQGYPGRDYRRRDLDALFPPSFTTRSPQLPG
jgi:cytosine/adenosine deaminase-related metal-dependent hydrolase